MDGKFKKEGKKSKEKENPFIILIQKKEEML
jgi:hypothetical protein